MKTSVVMFNVNGLDKRDYTCRCSSNGLSNQVLITVIVDITDDQIFEHFGVRAQGIKIQDHFREMTAERIAGINKQGVYTCNLSQFIPSAKAAKAINVKDMTNEQLVQESTAAQKIAVIESLGIKLTAEQQKALNDFKAQQEALRATAIQQVQAASKK